MHRRGVPRRIAKCPCQYIPTAKWVKSKPAAKASKCSQRTELGYISAARDQGMCSDMLASMVCSCKFCGTSPTNRGHGKLQELEIT